MDHVPRHIQQKFLTDFEELSDEFFRFVVYQTGNRDVAIDLVQDVWVETWNFIAAGNGIQNLRAFVYTVLRRRIIDWRRKKKSDSLDSMSDSGFDPRAAESAIADSAAREHVTIVHAAIAALSPSDSELIQLRFIQELPVARISEILGLPGPTLSVQIHRAKEKLKTELIQRGMSPEFLEHYET